VDQIIQDLLRPIKSILTSLEIEPSNKVHIYSNGFHEMVQSFSKI